jgi:hypothetical protein
LAVLISCPGSLCLRPDRRNRRGLDCTRRRARPRFEWIGQRLLVYRLGAIAQVLAGMIGSHALGIYGPSGARMVEPPAAARAFFPESHSFCRACPEEAARGWLALRRQG